MENEAKNNSIVGTKIKLALLIFCSLFVFFTILTFFGNPKINNFINNGSKITLVLLVLTIIVGSYLYLRFVKITIPCRPCEQPGWFYKCSDGTGLGSEICNTKTELITDAKQVWTKIKIESKVAKENIDEMMMLINKDVNIIKEKSNTIWQKNYERIMILVSEINNIYQNTIKPFINKVKDQFLIRFSELVKKINIFKNFMNEIKNNTKNFVIKKFQEFMNIFGNNFDLAKKNLKTFIDNFYNDIKFTINNIIEDLTNLYNEIYQNIIIPIQNSIDQLTKALNIVISFLSNVFNQIKELLETVIQTLFKIVNDSYNTIKKLFTDVIAIIETLAKIIGAQIIQAIKDIVEKFEMVAEKIIEFLKLPLETIKYIIDQINQNIDRFVKLIKETVQKLTQIVIEGLKLNELKESLLKLYNLITTNTTEFLNGFYDGVLLATPKQNTAQYIAGYSVGKLIPVVTNWVKATYDEVIEFITTKIATPIKEFFSDTFVWIYNIIEDTLYKMNEISQFLSEVFWNGIELTNQTIQSINNYFRSIIDRLIAIYNSTNKIRKQTSDVIQEINELDTRELKNKGSKAIQVVKTEAFGSIPRWLIFLFIILILIFVMAVFGIPLITINLLSK